MTSLVIPPGEYLERLWTGAVWSEGPVWLPETESVRWSDIHRNRILEFDSRTGVTRVYSENAEFANGRTLDREGRVLQCSHGRRRVEYEIDGDLYNVVDHWGQYRLNSPNDIVVASDGSIWFTDPPYGIFLPQEGHPGEMEYGASFVFRYVPSTGILDPIITDMQRPNGLAFSPDESTLYVSDTIDEDRGTIRSYDVDVALGTVNQGRDFAIVVPGCSDGFRVDVEGRIWSSSLDSVQVISPSGSVLEKISVPEKSANLCFGGVDGNDLYIAASSSLYRIRTSTWAAGKPNAKMTA